MPIYCLSMIFSKYCRPLLHWACSGEEITPNIEKVLEVTTIRPQQPSNLSTKFRIAWTLSDISVDILYLWYPAHFILTEASSVSGPRFCDNFCVAKSLHKAHKFGCTAQCVYQYYDTFLKVGHWDSFSLLHCVAECRLGRHELVQGLFRASSV